MRGLSVFKPSPWLTRNYVCRTWAFFALADLEFNLLAFIERCVAGGFYFRIMDENIIAAVIRSNKTISLTSIEPFYCTCTHHISPWPVYKAIKITPLVLNFILGILLRDERIFPNS